MTTLQHNSQDLHQEDNETDQPFKQANLGWEGHVHFPTGVPLWRRVLESWPELRTGLAYSLVFGAGVLLGSAVTSLVGTRQHKPER